VYVRAGVPSPVFPPADPKPREEAVISSKAKPVILLLLKSTNTSKYNELKCVAQLDGPYRVGSSWGHAKFIITIAGRTIIY
jgi:hypothetical protein